MNRKQFLLMWRVGLALVTALGILFSFPAFKGTIFPFLGVCFQAMTFLVLIVWSLHVRKQQAHKQQ